MIDQATQDHFIPVEEKGVPLPPIQLAKTFCSEPDDTPSEVIYGLTYRGSKIAIGGGSKSYKTWTLTDMAVSVAAGEPWLSMKTSKGKVLYINFEIQPFSFRKRVQAICKNKTIEVPENFEVWNLRGYSAPFEILIPTITKAAAERDYSLIVLDPTYKMLGERDENSTRDIAQMMNAMEKLAKVTSAAVAFAAHFSKGNQAGKESIDRMSGSGVYARDPDSILIFTKHETEGAFTVEATLRDFKPIEPFVVQWSYPQFRRNDELDPAKLKQPKKGGRRKKYTMEGILAVLGNKKLTTMQWYKKAQEEVGISNGAFHDLLRDEIKPSGKVKQDKKDRWALTPEIPLLE